MSEILSDKDKELVAAATQAIKARYRNDWQEVGAAIRTREANPAAYPGPLTPQPAGVG